MIIGIANYAAVRAMMKSGSTFGNNPVRHGLVKNAEDWPYQGVLNELRW
ncbi:MAG: hypothetical protein ACJ8NS_04645 [Chthoniobacterales bacterium]